MSARRFRNADPTANAAIRAADRAPRIPKDVAEREAARAKERGDMAGYDRFMAIVSRGGGE